MFGEERIMSDNNLDIAWKEIELVQLRGAIDTELPESVKFVS